MDVSDGLLSSAFFHRSVAWAMTDSFSFIHSGHFYSAPSSPLLLRGAADYSTDTVSEFHAEAHRQLQVKDLPKVPTWRLKRESNPCTTLRLKVIVSTKAPSRPFIIVMSLKFGFISNISVACRTLSGFP